MSHGEQQEETPALASGAPSLVGEARFSRFETVRDRHKRELSKNRGEESGDGRSGGAGAIRTTAWRKQGELDCTAQGGLLRPGGTVRPSRDAHLAPKHRALISQSASRRR